MIEKGMKRFLQHFQKAVALVLLICATVLPAMADSNNTLTIANLTVEAGSTATLNVNMKNSASICGVQFDLYLPAGITLAKDIFGDDDINIVGRTTLKRHSLGSGIQEDGALRVTLSSMQNATFSGTEGDIVSIALIIDATVAPGVYPIVMKKVELATPDEERYCTELVQATLTVKGTKPHVDLHYDINNDGEVTIADVNALIDYLLSIQY